MLSTWRNATVLARSRMKGDWRIPQSGSSSFADTSSFNVESEGRVCLLAEDLDLDSRIVFQKRSPAGQSELMVSRSDACSAVRERRPMNPSPTATSSRLDGSGIGMGSWT